MSNKLQPKFFLAIAKVIPDSFGHHNVSSLHSVLFRLKCKTTCRLHVGERCAVILNQVSVIGQGNSRSIVKILALFFPFSSIFCLLHQEFFVRKGYTMILKLIFTSPVKIRAKSSAMLVVLMSFIIAGSLECHHCNYV